MTKTEKFIKKACLKHGSKYDYSKVNYINAKIKVCIICPKHGEFWITPNKHLSGQGCKKCGINTSKQKQKLTFSEFVEKARKIHGDGFDYSKVNYVNAQTKVCIICPEHGEFWQTPTSHLNGRGCKKCGVIKRAKNNTLTTEIFIEKARKVHGDKYDYSKVEYVNAQTKICIICPEHGEFWQTPNSHLNGNGCRKCANKKNGERRLRTTEEFIELSCKIHENKYDYSKVEYKGCFEKVCIICHEIDPLTGKEHGEFWITPNKHLSGQGCGKCSGNKPLTTEEFIIKAKEIHGDKYDYSKVDYEKSNKKVCIICPTHGEFWQTPNNHLNGQGCGKCFESHLERDISKLLKKDGIIFIQQKTFDWLIYTSHQYLDFYLPEYNVAIECQGLQHFSNLINDSKFNEDFQTIKERDLNKSILCEKHGIKVIYYTYGKILPKDWVDYEVITDEAKLLMEIKK